jgi:hypothetical protein
MPALVASAEISAEDAFLSRLSIEVIPRLQREYLRATLIRFGEGAAISASTSGRRILIGGMWKARSTEFLRGPTRRFQVKTW